MYSKEEIKQLRVSFWEKFGQRCEIHPDLMFKKRKWILHRTKIKDVAFRFDVNRQNAQVILELGNRNENLRLQAFEFLEPLEPYAGSVGGVINLLVIICAIIVAIIIIVAVLVNKKSRKKEDRDEKSKEEPRKPSPPQSEERVIFTG